MIIFTFDAPVVRSAPPRSFPDFLSLSVWHRNARSLWSCLCRCRCRRTTTLAVTPIKFPLCTINSYAAVRTVGLALIRSVGPVAQHLLTRELEVNCSLPGRSRESRPVHLVRHCDDLTSNANRLVSGDLLHFKFWSGNRRVDASHVLRGGSLVEVVEDILRHPRWQILPYVATVEGVGGGIAALYRNVPVSIHAGHVERLIEI